ncbi:hypothetical protein QBC37DRAFT_394525 [Rhypophila decipiens]|uniref:Cell wall anchored protein n=1 Tax=Rhypophila decipiens TaxID=261697 RepID=A0AAN6YIB3_9PEZI|nr:hypothetical protein QBC37DRAFT_394525 [Rhypophila decipiens]
MAKNTITLVYLCVGAASYSMSPPLVPRQADGAVSASSFLRRAFHSSAFLDGRLYIDGGDFSYTSNNDTVYQFSNTLLSIDLTKHWTNSSVVLQSSSKPDGVPSLINGGIWTDLRNKLLYTGFAGVDSFFGKANAAPQGLWSFLPDGNGGGSWENLNNTADGIFVSRPRPFDGSVSSGGGSGYLLGGLSGNSSNFQNTPRGMFSYDFSSQNPIYGRDSGSSSAFGTQDGGMVFVPFFGNLGIIISAGGQLRQTNGGNGNGNGPNGGGGGRGGGGGDGQGSSTSTSLASFSTVQVYNPQDQKWYDQRTSGTAPSGRVQFCMTGMPSNNQTYEIFVYAGWDGNSGPGTVSFDDAYVLTLPGFHWVKADYTAEHPRYGLSCNAVGGGQVVTIGGADPTQKIQQGQVNNGAGYSAPFSTPDPFTQGLGVFDLSTLSWKTKYQPMRFPYTPAPQIQDYYNTNGRKPTAGFSSSSLESLFAQSDFSSPDNLPFPGGGTGRGGYRNNNDPSNAGAIAGGVVGGLAAASGIAALFIWLRRRHAKKHGKPKSTSNQSSIAADDYDYDDDNNSTTMRNLPAENNDTNARIEHANSSSRYPYSPSGFYNQPVPRTVGAAWGNNPGTRATVAGTSAAPAEIAGQAVEHQHQMDEEEAYAHAAGEKQPPPAYEEMEGQGQGGGRPGGGVAELSGDGTTTTTVTELLSSSSVGSENGNGDLWRNSRVVSGIDDTLVSAVDIVANGMRPPSQLPLPQVPELHGETSGRAELP